MDKEKINRVVNELEQLQFFKALNRFPKSFYADLNDEERAEVVKEYRRRNQLDKGRPFTETK